MARPIALLTSCLLLFVITACGGPTVTGVVSVQLPGGDRDLILTGSELLTPVVTAGSGVATTVTWSSSDDSTASVDAGGVVTAHALGTATVIATSTVDPTKSGSIVVSVVKPTTADGAVMMTIQSQVGAQPPTGAGLVLINADPSPPVPPASVVDIGYPFFAGPVNPIGEDDTVVVRLPQGSDLPDEVLTTADQFYHGIQYLTDCELDASSAQVRVTATAFEFITFPGVMVYGFEKTSFSIVATGPIDITTPPTPEELAELEFLTWAYAEADVSIATTGAGCDTVGNTLLVDVDLAEGWNQLGWHLEIDPATSSLTGLRLTNSDATDLYVTPAGI